MHNYKNELLLAIIASLIVGMGWFLFLFGWYPINTSHVQWLLNGDTRWQYIGWEFFRNAGWTWPITSNLNYLHGSNLSLIHNDAIPLIAVLLKLFIAKGANLQYFGLWLLSCFTLLPFMVLLICREAKISWPPGILLASFVTINPVILHRLMHLSLCAHWLILAFFLAYFKAKNAKFKQALFIAFIILFIALGVHPYWVAMLAPLYVFLLIQVGVKKKFLAAKISLLSIFLLGLEAWVLGYFYFGATKGDFGFGFFSADILGFFNPQDMVAWLPKMKVGGGQYEGFSYLGMGGIILCIGSIFLMVIKKIISFPYLFLPCVLLFLFSLSSHISLAGNEIINLDQFYQRFEFITAPLRSSGRFVWPIYYWILIMPCIYIMQKKIVNDRILCLILSILLCLQFYEVRAWARGKVFFPISAIDLNRVDEVFANNLNGATEIRLIPPRLDGVRQTCGGGYYHEQELNQWAMMAARANLKFNSGFAARVPGNHVKLLCESPMLGAIPGKSVLIFSYKMQVPNWLSCAKSGVYTVCRY